MLTSSSDLALAASRYTGEMPRNWACFHFMRPQIYNLRPIGNPVQLKRTSLDYSHFATSNIEFYQSGTASLAAALIAAKSMRKHIINPEVVLPAYTCPDLISACKYAGVTPVLVDLEPDSCWMSLEQIRKAINNHTIAIIAVRFLGIAERMAQLRMTCDEHNILLIEDSAQGFPKSNPATYWQGDLAILSFGRGKPVNMLGGGAVIVLKPDLKNHLPVPIARPENTQDSATYCLKLRLYNMLIKPLVYGLATKLPGVTVGETVYKPLKDIMAISPSIISKLNTNLDYYKSLPNIAANIHTRLQQLNLPGLIDLPQMTNHDFVNPLLRYPLLIKQRSKRDQLYQTLGPYGASLMYQKPLQEIRGVPLNLINTHAATLCAEKFSRQLITLPTHTGVTEKILDKLFDALINALN